MSLMKWFFKWRNGIPHVWIDFFHTCSKPDSNTLSRSIIHNRPNRNLHCTGRRWEVEDENSIEKAASCTSWIALRNRRYWSIGKQTSAVEAAHGLSIAAQSALICHFRFHILPDDDRIFVSELVFFAIHPFAWPDGKISDQTRPTFSKLSTKTVSFNR